MSGSTNVRYYPVAPESAAHKANEDTVNELRNNPAVQRSSGVVALSATGLVKRFGGVTALRGVSLDVRAGEVHALVGENGAGKSTLIKIITGAHVPDGGALHVGGRRVELFDPAAAIASGISAVYQQPALFRELTVAENLALRLERGSIWRRLNWTSRRQQARKLLDRVGASAIDADALVAELGIAQQQLVEIAAAIGAEARVVIFDEPTASLGERETENLFRVIQNLKSSGVGMIYVSHRLEELPRIADRVTVLRDGAHVATLPMATCGREELIRLMVGRTMEAMTPKLEATIGNIVLETKALSNSASGVRDISLSVSAGEILGIAGLVGAGRTELARILFGLTPATGGQILLKGKPVTIGSPRQAVSRGIAYLPEDRRRHGVVLEMTVAENTTLATLRQISSAGWIRGESEHQVASRFATRLGTKTASLDASVGTLSGGNQQKVAIARWLAAAPQVLILDEPTQGVDVGAKAEIHRLIGELAQKGMAIIMISSELPEVLGMSDRILVMRAGQIAGELTRAQATAEAILKLALGDAPARGAA